MRYNYFMVYIWIPEENLKPLLETVSGFIRYELDEWDWTAISFGITHTNSDREEWYEYPLVGDQTIEVSIAADWGSGLIFIHMQSDPKIEEKCEIAMGIFQEYTLK